MSDATIDEAGGKPARAKQRAFLPERLYSRLDDARRAPITLVIGEEGLGKSTLIRDYLAMRGTPHLRFTAGPEHGTPGDLLRGLARTFGTVSPAMARSCGIAVQKLEAGDGASVAVGWAREHLDGIRATVVLDDLHHVLAMPRCASFLAELIEATIPNVTWILAVRDASALPVPRWLSSGRCGLPIESDELRVRPDEVVAEFARAGVAIDETAAAALCARTHGWPLGLRVALATGCVDDALTRDEVYERLVDAAFQRCTREQSDRLFELATIGRFDDAVLTALECEPRFRDLLDECELVHAVDDASDTLHEPARAHIAKRLRAIEPERRAAIHERAAATLERLGRWREAIDMRAEDGDAERLAATLERCGFHAVEHGEVRCVARALAQLGDETTARHPVALAVKATLASLDESFDVSEVLFGMAIERASERDRRELVLRYGMDLVRRGRPDAVDVLEAEAARDGARASADEDAALWALLGTAYVAAQNIELAREAAARAVMRLPGVVDDGLRARVLHQAAYVALNDRDWDTARRLAERALSRAEDLFLYDLAARALSVVFNVAWLHAEDAEAARDALARLDEAGRKAGSEPLRLYAILNAYAIEVDAGDVHALERFNRQLADMQVLMTRAVTEALLPAQALRAAWDGNFTHAYDLLAPGATKLVDHLRAAYRWAEVALYGAAANKVAEARDAIDASRERLAAVAATEPLAVRTIAYLALAETVLGDDATAAASIDEARAASVDAPARVRSLIDCVTAFYGCRKRGPTAVLALGERLDALEQHALGGVARLIARLPVATIERGTRWTPGALGVAG